MRFLVQSLGILLLTIGVLAPVGAARSSELLAERALGDPAAPVTIIEYSSLTCPHCATFHNETLPQIKETYIETGKARFIYRDHPLNTPAALAAMVARCVDEERYFGFLDVLYRDLQGWAGSDDIRGQLQIRARLAGLSSADFEACVENRELFDALNAARDEAAQTVGVESTPTFQINGRKVTGAQPYEVFAEIIDEELAAAPQPGN